DAVVDLCTTECRFATVDGRRAEGREEVRRLLSSFMGDLRSTSHQVTEMWHQEDVWLAEVLATYEMRDWLKIEALPRAFVIRAVPEGICDVRVYGANERQLNDRSGDEPYRSGGHLVLPL
ncbi:MAG: hypothetical protein JO337_04345, partial [Acidimicrobiales bacterium]|nr:hypothetical protein [Acidimicrobiales bacterium]